MGLVIYVFIHWLEYKQNEKKPKLLDIYWFIYGSLLRQSSNYDPDTNATKMLVGTWWIFVVIMTASVQSFWLYFWTRVPVNSRS